MRHPTNDEPDIDINLLPERQRLLKKLIENIRHTKPPIVFGIHGDWGAGKTSFLQSVMYELTGSCPSCPKPNSADARDSNRKKQWKEAPVAVWFEAWRYQKEPSPVIALLHEMREQLSAWAQSKGVVKDTALAVWRNFMLALDSIMLKVETEVGVPGHVSGKVGAQISPFQMAKSMEEVRSRRLSTPLPSNQIRDALDEVLRGLFSSTNLASDHHRVVVFIDDLDRCSASSMFSLLESIKIYLNLKHCVFVLGINRHELERNIASILPEPLVEQQRQVRAHEYIEKLCGNIIRLPYPSEKSVGLMVEKWLEPIDGIDRTAEGIVNNDHSSNRGLLINLVSQRRILPLNPRRIKMWCNAVLHLYWNRAKDHPNGTLLPIEEQEMPALALAACLHTFYPSLYHALQAAPSFIDALKKWCVAEQRFDPDLEIFSGLMRVFVTPKFISSPSREESEATDDWTASGVSRDALSVKFEAARKARLERLQFVLCRAYGWSENTASNDDREPVEHAPVIIPLLTDPSSLQYFHPQHLLAEENITIDLVRPYLHLD